jgi:hypothetical protein
MRRTRWLVPAIALIAAGCGASSDSTGPTSSATSPPTVVSITVTSGSGSLSAVGQTRQLTAIATMSDGTTKDITATATWTSGNTTVASVSSSGVVTAVGSGTVTVTVSYQGKTATISFTLALTVSSGNVLTATIDGAAFVATTVVVVKGPGVLSIGGVNGFTGAYIDLTVAFPPTLGTYTLPASNIVALLTVATGGGWSADEGSGSGTLTVSTLTSNSASGTFSFSMPPETGSTGTKAVTNGVFKVTF